jgi:NAD(P)-dependent dehydrogenase (short-subunit alcohol dehydrogenase family)
MTSTRSVLITGGASGIGFAVAQSCLELGFGVALLDRNEAALSQAQAQLAACGRVITIIASVSDEAALDAACTRTEIELGPLHGAVNSAGIGLDAQALDTELDAFRTVIEVNLLGSFALSKAVARRMLPRGCGAIVNIASVSGMTGNVGRTAYGATKAGVIAMTKVMAAELSAQGLRINAVAPGPIETPMVRDVHTADMRQAWIDTVPQRRYGTPEEIAQAVVFLLDETRSSYITGQVLAVDGGFTATGILSGVTLKSALVQERE